MKTPIDSNLYFAKATQPAGNPWRSPWTSADDALNKARKFVRDWLDVGVQNVEACVFYRTGDIACVKHWAGNGAIPSSVTTM